MHLSHNVAIIIKIENLMERIGKIEFANTLRGFAAISVIIAHYFGVFWLARDAVAGFINAPSLPVEYFATPSYIQLLNSWKGFSFGAFGVALFFLISGFVIPFSFKKNNGMSFLVNRVFRIFPTYMVGFSVTIVSLYFACRFFSSPWPYSTTEIVVHYFPGLRDVFWSRNIDGVIWTLEVEVKFYVVCAVFISFFRRQSVLVFLAPVLIAGLFLFASTVVDALANSNQWLYLKILAFMYSAIYLVYMFIGVALHYLHMNILKPSVAYLLVASLFFLFSYLWVNGLEKENLNVLLNYGGALVVFLFAYAFPDVFKGNRLFDFMANISYPLYVVHGMFGYVALRILLELRVKAWLSLLVVSASAILIAWIVHLFVEGPSQSLGKRFARLIQVRSGTAEAA